MHLIKLVIISGRKLRGANLLGSRQVIYMICPGISEVNSTRCMIVLVTRFPFCHLSCLHRKVFSANGLG